jgi:hypothetical protein
MKDTNVQQSQPLTWYQQHILENAQINQEDQKDNCKQQKNKHEQQMLKIKTYMFFDNLLANTFLTLATASLISLIAIPTSWGFEKIAQGDVIEQFSGAENYVAFWNANQSRALGLFVVCLSLDLGLLGLVLVKLVIDERNS